jgi:hypothetical protein
MFVHMPRDGRTAGYVKSNAQLLKSIGVPVRARLAHVHTRGLLRRPPTPPRPGGAPPLPGFPSGAVLQRGVCRRACPPLGPQVRIIEVEPMPLNKTFFSARAPGNISAAQSAATFDALDKAGMLDERRYLDQNPRWAGGGAAWGAAEGLLGCCLGCCYLRGCGPRCAAGVRSHRRQCHQAHRPLLRLLTPLTPPCAASRRRASSWREVLHEARVPGIEQMPLNSDESPLSELLNLAWAEHEICSNPTTEFLDWVEGGFKEAAD